MIITQGYAEDGTVVIGGLVMPPAGRTIIWNSQTNIIPKRTPPVLSVAYAPDRRSAVVTMSCDVNDAVIRYTTNGRYAVTHVNSPIYTGPITVKQSAVFHACWHFNGLRSEPERASVYLRNG